MARALDLEEIIQRRAELLGPFWLRPRARGRGSPRVRSREREREAATRRKRAHLEVRPEERVALRLAHEREGKPGTRRARVCDARSAREAGCTVGEREARARAHHSRSEPLLPPPAPHRRHRTTSRRSVPSLAPGPCRRRRCPERARGPALAEGGRRRRARRWRRRREQLEHLGRFIRLAALRWRATAGRVGCAAHERSSGLARAHTYLDRVHEEMAIQGTLQLADDARVLRPDVREESRVEEAPRLPQPLSVVPLHVPATRRAAVSPRQPRARARARATRRAHPRSASTTRPTSKLRVRSCCWSVASARNERVKPRWTKYSRTMSSTTR